MLSPGYSISPQELWNKIATPSAPQVIAFPLPVPTWVMVK
jgi:hypothetical protein